MRQSYVIRMSHALLLLFCFLLCYCGDCATWGPCWDYAILGNNNLIEIQLGLNLQFRLRLRARTVHAGCVSRVRSMVLQGGGGGRKKGRLSFGLRGLHGICTPSVQKKFKTFYALMCRILRLHFFTYCPPLVLSLFGPASPCWLNPMPDA